jgi:hypothetical protein
MPETQDFFDASFLGELEDLAALPQAAAAPLEGALPALLAEFVAASPSTPHGLSAEAFVALGPGELAERVNLLIELCRRAGRSGAVHAVESFIVFFQALLPTLSPEGAAQIKAFVYRLVPTLLQIAHNDFGDDAARRVEGGVALRDLETVLLEIASVRLSPAESELVFRSIDQMAGFIGIGEYAMASGLISTQLLGLIRRNKLTRILYGLMEVEVNVQTYLKEKLGRTTPWVQVPEDFEALAEYGPVRLLHEESLLGSRRLIQVQVPGAFSLRDVVLHLSSRQGGGDYELRLDALGSAELNVPAGAYALGLSYRG